MAEDPDHNRYVAFAGEEIIADGDLLAVALALRAARPSRPGSPLVFNCATGRQTDIDVRGTKADLIKRFGPSESAGGGPRAATQKKRGRPKLGVIGREVTLLPRQWQWLDEQRGGASATLRRIVDESRQANRHRDLVRQAQDRTNRFLSAIAGNLAGFEEATRALYAGDESRFIAESKNWPRDIRLTATAFAEPAFAESAPSG